MTLSDRLQTELIGEDTSGRHIPHDGLGVRCRKEQRQALNPTIANIKADLKGLLREHLGECQWRCASFKDMYADCDCRVAKAMAAIEHYCRDKA